MEPWLIIVLIAAGLIVLAIAAWLLIAIISLVSFNRQAKRMDRDFENFRNGFHHL